MKSKDLLIFYGWPSCFNSGVNQWDLDRVAEDMSKYSVIVFGGGLQETSHGDHTKMNTIISKIRNLNPEVEIYGYVTTAQSYIDFKIKTNDWINNVGVDGIFMDEAGYDYGSVDTNGREAFNLKVNYVHSHELICFVNAWNLNNVIGVENDPNRPNSIYNPDELISYLCCGDICLLESFGVNTESYPGDYEASVKMGERIQLANELREECCGLRLAAVAVIADRNKDGQEMFDFSYIAGLMSGLDIFGSSDENYGSTDSNVKYWDRKDYANLIEVIKP